MQTGNEDAMDTDNILKIVLREMRAYGQGFRIAEFLDGRMVRRELNALAQWAEDPNRAPNYTDGTDFLKDQE